MESALIFPIAVRRHSVHVITSVGILIGLGHLGVAKHEASKLVIVVTPSADPSVAVTASSVLFLCIVCEWPEMELRSQATLGLRALRGTTATIAVAHPIATPDLATVRYPTLPAQRRVRMADVIT